MSFENPDVNSVEGKNEQHSSSRKQLGKIARAMVALGILSMPSMGEAHEDKKDTRDMAVTVELKEPSVVAPAPEYELRTPTPEPKLNTPTPVQEFKLNTPTDYERKTPTPEPKARPLDDFKM